MCVCVCVFVCLLLGVFCCCCFFVVVVVLGGLINVWTAQVDSISVYAGLVE